MLWKIETTGKPGVFHLAPEGTQEPLCQARHATGTVWRTPPKAIRGDRLCGNCAPLAARGMVRAFMAWPGLR